MALNRINKILPLLLLVATVFVGCKVSYKLTGASIDYTKVKTISLETFQNRAPYQWGPMAPMLNETLSDVFIQQTKLRLLEFLLLLQRKVLILQKGCIK